tara:strand:- start:712 stop:1173 length:462 start_codon:yes stop_codon:yes gene_type:complete
MILFINYKFYVPHTKQEDKMKHIFILIFLINLIYSDTITGYDLYRSLNKKNSKNINDYNDYETATAYIMGVISAMSHSRKLYTSLIAEYIPDKKAGENLGIALMPLNRQWNTEQYIAVVHHYMRNNPHHLKFSATENISLALFEASIASSGKL